MHLSLTKSTVLPAMPASNYLTYAYPPYATLAIAIPLTRSEPQDHEKQDINSMHIIISSKPPSPSHRMTPHSPTIPFAFRPSFPFPPKTSQNLNVSSPAPVTIIAPSGLMLKYSTR